MTDTTSAPVQANIATDLRLADGTIINATAFLDYTASAIIETLRPLLSSELSDTLRGSETRKAIANGLLTDSNFKEEIQLGAEEVVTDLFKRLLDDTEAVDARLAEGPVSDVDVNAIGDFRTYRAYRAVARILLVATSGNDSLSAPCNKLAQGLLNELRVLLSTAGPEGDGTSLAHPLLDAIALAVTRYNGSLDSLADRLIKILVAGGNGASINNGDRSVFMTKLATALSDLWLTGQTSNGEQLITMAPEPSLPGTPLLSDTCCHPFGDSFQRVLQAAITNSTTAAHAEWVKHSTTRLQTITAALNEERGSQRAVISDLQQQLKTLAEGSASLALELSSLKAHTRDLEARLSAVAQLPDAATIESFLLARTSN